MGPDFWDDFSRKRNVSDGCCLFVSGFLGPGFRDVRQVPLSGGQKRIVGKQNLRASICKNKKKDAFCGCWKSPVMMTIIKVMLQAME